MAKARAIPGLGPQTPFRVAAACAVETRADELFEHGRRVLDTADIKRVHNMRVASRRLRASLELFAPAFPKKEHKRVLREVKALADALGARRDADVALAELGVAADELGPEARPGIESLADELRAEQEVANDRLAEMLGDVREGRLEERLRRFAHQVEAV